jgi:hypothetical protein
MEAAELLFHRWQSILDMAGECKHSFAFPGAIFRRSDSALIARRNVSTCTNACTPLIDQNGFAKNPISALRFIPLSLLHSVAFRYDTLNKRGENNAPNWVYIADIRTLDRLSLDLGGLCVYTFF